MLRPHTSAPQEPRQVAELSEMFAGTVDALDLTRSQIPPRDRVPVALSEPPRRHGGSQMSSIQLQDARVEETSDQLYAVFDLNDTPDPAWIVRFEECLAKHTTAAVAIADQRIRIEISLATRRQQLTPLVERCIEEANVADMSGRG